MICFSYTLINACRGGLLLMQTEVCGGRRGEGVVAKVGYKTGSRVSLLRV